MAALSRILPNLILTGSLVIPQAHAVDIYVDQSNSAGGNGSSEQPFRNLQDGISAAQPGDTVHVRPGVYGAVRTVRSGTEKNRITIVAEQRRKAIVQATDRTLDVAHPYHTFRGIVFDSGYGPRQVIRTNGADHLELVDIEARRGTSNCIALGTVRHVLITESTIHHCINHFDPAKNADSHGITASSVTDLTVRNTEIYLVTGDAVQVSPSRQPWDEVRIEGCTLWSGVLDESANGWQRGKPIGENAIDTKVGAELLNGNGERPRLTVVDTLAFGWRDVITNQGAYNIKESVDAVFDRVTIRASELGFRLRFPALVRIQNAVVYDVDYAFRLEGGLRDARILNSTIGTDIRRAPFRNAGGTPKNLVLKNLLFLSPGLPEHARQDPSNLAVDTDAFLDATTHDYRLSRIAPARDAGETLEQVPHDRNGTPRPSGTRYDIGAHEAPTTSN